MDKIKSVFHIHDKTPIPNDGAVGNMQNPSSTGQSGPTATDLWGAGNAETVHHHDHKSDTIAAAAVENPKHSRSQLPAGGLENSVSTGQDDAYASAQRAQQQGPLGTTTSDSLGSRAVAQDTLQSSMAEEKAGSSATNQWAGIEPRNEPEPSTETGPGSHFRTGPTSGITSTGATSATRSGREGGLSQQDTIAPTGTGIATRGGGREGGLSQQETVAPTGTGSATRSGADGDSSLNEHTTFYDAVTGREAHEPHARRL